MRNQKGAALIVVLSMLTASLMVGLTSMQSSMIDERLAGNYRALADAQMAAEKAASAGFEAAETKDQFPGTSLGDLRNITWSEFNDNSNFEGGAGPVAGGCENASCYYRYVKVGDEYYIVAMGGVGDGGFSVSEPVVVKVSFGSGFNDLSPLTSPQKIASFSSSSGGARPKGMGFVPDVLVSDSGDAQDIENIYNGVDGFEVSTVFVDKILSDPEDADGFSDFISALKSQSDSEGNTFDGDVSGGKNNNTRFGSPGSPQVSFVNGGISSNNISGSGVLVVNGSFESNGNPSFDGLIIVLGDYVPGSGGGGDDINGSLVVAPYVSKEDPSEKNIECNDGCKFSEARIEFGTGGGGFDLTHDSVELSKAFSLLSDEAKTLWDPEAGDGGGNSGKPTIDTWQ